MKRLLLLLAVAPSVALAQSYTYPAFQQPRVVEREYNFAAAAAGRAGTSLLFQWREGVSPEWQLGVDAGLASPDGNAATRLLLGGTAARELARATADFPFDIVATGGVGFSSSSGHSVVRIPVGAAVGHSFPLDGGLTITPFVHPRISVDRCSDCKAGNPASKLNVNVDIGAGLQITDQVAVRVAAVAGGHDYLGNGSGIGLSVAWTPKGLRKP